MGILIVGFRNLCYFSHWMVLTRDIHMIISTHYGSSTPVVPQVKAAVHRWYLRLRQR